MILILRCDIEFEALAIIGVAADYCFVAKNR